MGNGKAVARQEPPAVPGELGQELLDRLDAGMVLSVVRSQNQIAVARQRPRDLDKIFKEMKVLAAQAAEDFYYSIPFKNHVQGCQNPRSCDCPVTRVEGPGVGLTRALFSIYTNVHLEVRCDSETADAWTVTATFIDLEKNSVKTESKIVKKLKPIKGGKWVKASAKDEPVIFQQAASKVERDVVRRSVSAHLIQVPFELAKAAALMDKKPPDEQIARLIHKFGEVHVTLVQLEGFLGHALTVEAIQKSGADVKETLATLRGLVTGLKGGEVTLEEVFGLGERPEGAAPKKAPAAPGHTPVTPEDIESPKAKAKTKAKAPTGAPTPQTPKEEPPPPEAEAPPPTEGEEQAGELFEGISAKDFWAKINKAGLDPDGVTALAARDHKEIGVPAAMDDFTPEHFEALLGRLRTMCRAGGTGMKDLLELGEAARSALQAEEAEAL